MPEANPDATFAIVLSQHQNVSTPDQPRLIFRALTVRDRKNLLAACASADRAADGADTNDAEAYQRYLDAYFDAIKANLVGWENQTDEQGKPLAFDPADLDRVIADADVFELKFRLIQDSVLSAGEKKRCASQSPSSTDSAASGAAVGSASTSPATPAPST